MSITTIFLHKKDYFNKDLKLGINCTINNLSEFIQVYLNTNKNIDNIYIAGACYSRDEDNARKLIHACFGNAKTNSRKFNIHLISKYNRFSYTFTINSIFHYGHSAYKNKLDKKSDHKKMMFFLEENVVCAILIGSSNFSNNTYLNKSSNEADIFMYDESKSQNSDFNSLIYNNEEVDYVENGEKPKFWDNVLISKSINSPKDFLQNIYNNVTENMEFTIIENSISLDE